MDTQSHSQLNRDNPSVQKILQAAGAVFGRRGYKGASMAAIAREAGVSKSLLHYHFDSKEHLLIEVQLQLCRGLLDHVRGLTRATDRSLEHFQRMLGEVMAFVEQDLEQIQVLLEFHSVARANPRVAKHLQSFQDEIVAMVVTGVENVLGPMVDRLLIPPERVARLLMTLLNGLIVDLAYAENYEDGRQRVHETFDDVRTLLTRALFADLS